MTKLDLIGPRHFLFFVMVYRRRRFIRRRRARQAGLRTPYKTMYRLHQIRKKFMRGGKRVFRVPRLALSHAGFPQKLNVKLRYNRIFTANAAAGAASVVPVATFNPNSLSVPDPAAGSHQPMFHDNLAALYEKYRVNFFKVQVIVVNNIINVEQLAIAPALAANNVCRLILQRDTVPGTYSANSNVMTELGRHPDLKWRYINAVTTQRLPGLTITGRPHDMFQVSRGEQNLNAAFGASPASLCYLNVLVANASDLNASIGMSFNVIITFYATVFDLLENQPLN